jgi:hypothetical protein
VPPLVLALCLALALSACAARAPVSAPPQPPGAANAAGLSVRLLWNEPVDLDLYLTDPSWETLYFANNPTRAGAKMERDARCDTLGPAPPFVETALLAAPAAGPYRIGVHFIDACASDVGEAAVRLVVDLDGERLERVATLRRDEFRVVALEFEIGAGATGNARIEVGPPDDEDP